ncbi:MAG: hypothetical protein HYY86_03105 [Candidatus Harrisonbacteria bacterium]|nr:hypothetical protein [Candidatus Harrisonbacteria bacterium]
MFIKPPPDRHCDFCGMIYGLELPRKETIRASRNFLAFFENKEGLNFILIIPNFHEQQSSRLLQITGLKEEAEELAKKAVEVLENKWRASKYDLKWNDGKVPQCGITHTGPFIRKGTHAHLKVLPL